MTLRRWVFGGWITDTAETWAAVPEDATPSHDQAIALAHASLPLASLPENTSTLRFLQWADVDVAADWIAQGLRVPHTSIDAATADYNARIDALRSHEGQAGAVDALIREKRRYQWQTVTDAWTAFGNACKALNISPWSVKVFRDACEAAWTSDGNSNDIMAGAWSGMIQQSFFASHPDVSWDMGSGGDYIEVTQLHHLLWMNRDGTLDVRYSLDGATDDPTVAVSRDWDVTAWANDDTSSRPGRGDAWSFDYWPSMRWYMDIVWGALQYLQGAGPLGAIWNAWMDAARENAATLIANPSLNGRTASLLHSDAELIDRASTDGVNANVNLLQKAASTVESVPVGGYEEIFAAVIEIIAIVYQLIGGAVAEVRDVWGRLPPVFEGAPILTDGLLPDDTAAPQTVVDLIPRSGSRAPRVGTPAGAVRPAVVHRATVVPWQSAVTQYQPAPKGMSTAGKVAVVGGVTVAALAIANRRRLTRWLAR